MSRYTDHKSIIILYNVQMLGTRDLHLTLYRMMMDLWSVYLTFYRMTPRWTRDLHLNIIQNDDGLVICISGHFTEWHHVGTRDSVYLTLYRMAFMLGLVICIWHYIEWRHVGLVICVSGHYTWWCNVGTHDSVYLTFLQNDAHEITSPNMFVILYNGRYTDHKSQHAFISVLCQIHLGLVICASDIIQNDAMLGLVICVSDIIQKWRHVGTCDLCICHYTEWQTCWDSWSVYLTLYRMAFMLALWSCIWHYTEWRHGWTNDLFNLTLYRMTPCWDLWSVCLTLYRMMMGLVDLCNLPLYRMTTCWDSWSVYLTLYWMMPRWTRDLCIWHYTEWTPMLGLVICVSDIIQNGSTLDLWSVCLTLYRMMKITSPNMFVILYNGRYTDHGVQHGSILYNIRLHRSQVQHHSV